MDLNEIKKLIALMDDGALSEIEVEDSERRICLKRALTVPAVPSAALISTPVENLSPSQEVTEEKTELLARQHLITSPIVGTFYISASPATSAYVEVGDLVKKGQIICIVEAMKLMNEIESDVDGRVVRVCVEDGAAVEYAEALFAIEPA